MTPCCQTITGRNSRMWWSKSEVRGRFGTGVTLYCLTFDFLVKVCMTRSVWWLNAWSLLHCPSEQRPVERWWNTCIVGQPRTTERSLYNDGSTNIRFLRVSHHKFNSSLQPLFVGCGGLALILDFDYLAHGVTERYKSGEEINDVPIFILQ